MRRNTNNKHRLYESIMRDVSKTIKKHLNEARGITLTENDLVDLAVNFIN